MINIKETLNQFLSEMELDKPHRYKSWEICHNTFFKYKDKKLSDSDIDFLALHLGFYLASWGMYRGSSFLLQNYDYTIHKETVKIAMQYVELFNINPFEEKEKYINLLFGDNGLYLRLNNYYTKLRNAVKSSNEKLSITLITKILMGIFGCIPAYDRFFIEGITNAKISITKQKRPNIESLLDYVLTNEDMLISFKEILNKLNIENRNYTIMKIIDMYFWQIGKNKNC